jgi:MFS family permease
MTTAPDQPVAATDGARGPVRRLPMSHLLRLSIYWFGIQAIWAGIDGVIIPRRVDAINPDLTGTIIALITTAGVLMAIAVQPTIGVISDYTMTRWGRRKPFIVIGTVLDVVFLAGIATSNELVAIGAFVVLLQLSSNFAQGPFQGYVPDLVPAEQVGTVSGFMGLMIMLGQIGGGLVATLGLLALPEVVTAEAAREAFLLPTIGLGLVELATMVALVVTVRDERPPTPRAGRTWRQVALSAWGTDLLRERNVLWVLTLRLFFLAATAGVTRWAILYLDRSLGLSNEEQALWFNVALITVGLVSAVTTYPAARLSDRFGRRTVILAACAIGAVGLAGAAVAPSVGVAIGFLVLFGIGTGAFLSADWALMTDVIPKDATGRYMGILNVGTAAAGPLALATGGVLLDLVTRFDREAGPRVAIGLGVVFLALCAAALTRVDPRRREVEPLAAAPTP